jgi:UTP--glucose-1-phosphate uridylyltransferase
MEDRQNMESKNIDVDLSLDILARFNRGDFDHFEPIRVDDIPSVDGTTIVDFTAEPSLGMPVVTAKDRLAGVVPSSALDRFGRGIGTVDGETIQFSRTDLETIGLLVMPRVAYGVLNGGSATSYADRKKNRSFSSELVGLLQSQFDEMAEISRGHAKGLTPAFVQPDGTLGPSFLKLKMRGLLIMAMRSRATIDRLCPGKTGELPDPLLPFFEMTSIQTNEELRTSYMEYRSDLSLADLIALTGLDPTDPIGAVQPLIAAYTHSDDGRPKRIFTRAYGRDHETLPLPGGHGQNFSVLTETYRSLRTQGKRFVYIGNVDNLGYLPDPVEVAYLALSGKQAGFDFAFRTPVDVKGGILVRDQHGHLSCADIGPAISREDVGAAESVGKPILFNAATGLFDLDFLVPNLEKIANDLPTRFTDQSKDAGDYSQAEQVTWEVLGMLDDFLVFSVSKWDRLLAAKLLTETLMTSGIGLDDPNYPSSDDPAADLRGAATKLHEGLVRKLQSDYAMELVGQRWGPVPATVLNERYAE